jgi:hypothetical protein
MLSNVVSRRIHGNGEVSSVIPLVSGALTAGAVYLNHVTPRYNYVDHKAPTPPNSPSSKEVGGSTRRKNLNILSDEIRRRKTQSIFKLDDVPPAQLVGVELNPGPPKGVKHEKPQLPGPPKKKQKMESNSSSNLQGQLVSVPVARSRIITKQSAMRTNLPNGDVIITHHEYFADIACAINFTTTGYIINPGNPAMFPWLSKIAPAFEKYEFKKLCIRYVTDVSTATSGRIMLAVDFDSTDIAPQSKSQMLTYRNSVAGPVWSEICYEANNKDLHALPQYYISPLINTLSSITGQNALDRQQNVGNLWAASQNGTNTNGGELYVEYTVRLINPQSSSIGAAYYAISDGTVDVTGTRSSLFSASVPSYGGTNNIVSLPSENPGTAGVSYVTSGAITGLVFAIPGKYMISGILTGAGFANLLSVGLGSSTVAQLVVNGVFYYNACSNSTNTAFVFALGVRVTAPNQTFLPVLSSPPTSFSRVNYVVDQLDVNATS